MFRKIKEIKKRVRKNKLIKQIINFLAKTIMAIWVVLNVIAFALGTGFIVHIINIPVSEILTHYSYIDLAVIGILSVISGFMITFAFLAIIASNLKKEGK